MLPGWNQASVPTSRSCGSPGRRRRRSGRSVGTQTPELTGVPRSQGRCAPPASGPASSCAWHRVDRQYPNGMMAAWRRGEVTGLRPAVLPFVGVLGKTPGRHPALPGATLPASIQLGPWFDALSSGDGQGSRLVLRLRSRPTHAGPWEQHRNPDSTTGFPTLQPPRRPPALPSQGLRGRPSPGWPGRSEESCRDWSGRRCDGGSFPRVGGPFGPLWPSLRSFLSWFLWV